MSSVHPFRAVRCALLSVAILLGGMPLLVQAATKTATFQVRLVLQNDCIISATDLDFGTHGVLDTNIDQTSTISVTCTNTAGYNVGLNAGSATGSTIANRLVISPANDTVGYQMYRDSNRTLVWGDTVGTDTVSGTGTGAAQSLTVYGRVPPQATPAAATYTSNVIATITF